MKHFDPNKLPIVLSRKARMVLACAAHHQDMARFCRDRARHKLRIGDLLGHHWMMQDALREWRKAKEYFREARTNG